MKSLFILAVLTVVMLGTTQSSYAVPVVFTANLSGPAEAPPNASPGTGFSTVTYDSVAHTLRVQITFSGLLGNTTASHIHSSATNAPGTGATGVATQTPSFVGFPLGVTSGTFDSTLDLTLASSWNAPFIAANGGTTASAEAALFTQMLEGRSYVNIHTSQFGSGEIRGFLQTPEPATIVLLGSGLAGLASSLRRRRKVKNSQA